MSSISRPSVMPVFRDRVVGLRSYMGWVLALGMLQIVAGVFAVGSAFSWTIASVVTLGVLLLVAAGAQLACAILAPTWRGFFLFLAFAVIYCGAGVYSLAFPIAAAARFASASL